MTLKTESIEVTRSEANFDRACDSAWQTMMRRIGMDDDGYATKVPGWERSRATVTLSFVAYFRVGEEHVYGFTGRVSKEARS